MPSFRSGLVAAFALSTSVLGAKSGYDSGKDYSGESESSYGGSYGGPSGSYSGSSGSSCPSVLKNGGFETGKISPWDDTDSDITIASGSLCRSGNYCLQVGTDGAVALQEVNTIPGNKYQVTIYTRPSKKAVDDTFFVGTSETQIGEVTYKNSKSWVKTQDDFTASDTTTYLSLYIYTYVGHGDVYVDDVSIIDITKKHCRTLKNPPSDNSPTSKYGNGNGGYGSGEATSTSKGHKQGGYGGGYGGDEPTPTSKGHGKGGYGSGHHYPTSSSVYGGSYGSQPVESTKPSGGHHRGHHHSYGTGFSSASGTGYAGIYPSGTGTSPSGTGTYPSNSSAPPYPISSSTIAPYVTGSYHPHSSPGGVHTHTHTRTHTHPAKYTTSVVCSTKTHTDIYGSTITETVALYTTICPVTETEAPTYSAATYGSPAPAEKTPVVVYSTVEIVPVATPVSPSAEEASPAPVGGSPAAGGVVYSSGYVAPSGTNLPMSPAYTPFVGASTKLGSEMIWTAVIVMATALML